MADKVAFIGLGHMGGPMAMHLACAGYDIAVHTRTRSKAEAFVAEYGGRLAETPAEAAREAVFVAFCVLGDEASRQVAIGADGAFAAMAPGGVCVDHTTTTTETAEVLAAAAAEHGVHYLDAPISGAEEGAKAGAVTVMAGGPAEGFEKAKPFMDAYSKQMSLLGPTGHGQLTKMLNQILISATMQGLAEAIVLGRSAGLDVHGALDLLGRGSAQSWWLDNRAGRMIDGELDPVDGGISIMTNDLGKCLDEGRRRGVALPVTAIISQFFGDVRRRGRHDWESPSLITLWDDRYE
jgi:3-hydroxyisobutyrate dehydrogenase-like beta-hydroxyacid dehydrogenase